VLKVSTETFLKQKQKRFFRWYSATSHQTQVYKNFCWLHVKIFLVTEGAGDILANMHTRTRTHRRARAHTHTHTHNLQDIQNYYNTITVMIAYPGRDNRFFCSLKHPDQPWGPPNRLFNVYQGFPWGHSGQGMKLTPLHLPLALSMSGAIPVLSLYAFRA
jgi:hypothetical protein